MEIASFAFLFDIWQTIFYMKFAFLPLGKKPKGRSMQNIAEGLRRPERLWFDYHLPFGGIQISKKGHSLLSNYSYKSTPRSSISICLLDEADSYITNNLNKKKCCIY